MQNSRPNKPALSRDLKSGIVLFAFTLLIFWESLRAGLGTFSRPGSGFLLFLGNLALCAFSIELIRRGRKMKESGMTHSHRVILALLSLFVYSLTLEFLGFIIPTFLLVGILLRIQSPRPWWAVTGISIIVTGLAYIVFARLLHVYFPPGILGI